MSARDVSRQRRQRHRVTMLDAVSHGLFGTVAAALATAPIWPLYGTARVVVVALAAAIVGAVLGAAAAGRRWRASTSILSIVLAYAVLGVPLAVPGRAWHGVLPTPSGLGELARGTVQAWKQLVTVTGPVGTYEALAVPVFALCLVGSVVAVRLALRPRGTAWAVAPALVVAALSIALGPSEPSHPWLTGAGLFAVVVTWLMWLTERSRARHRERDSSHRRGRAATVLTVVAVFAVATTATGAAVAAVAPPARSPQVLRDAVVPQFDPRTLVSPLSSYRQHFAPDEADSAMMTVESAAGVDDVRVRVAALDAYDGVVFSLAPPSGERGAFTRVPAARETPDDAGAPIEATITIDHYAQPWVPSMGSLVDVSFSGDHGQRVRRGLVYDSTTGTLASSAQLEPGDAYVLTARQRPWTPLEALGQLRPVDSSQTVVPPLPDGLDEFIARSSAGESGAGARLAATLEAISSGGYLSHGQPGEPASRSGHSLDRLGELLDSAPMVGDDEQYAVLAALAARRLGFDSRVVVGYRAEADAGPVTLYGRDASAWIEVETTRGWMPVYPSPTQRSVPDDDVDEQEQTVVPPDLSGRDAEQDAAESQQVDGSEEDDAGEQPPAATAAWLVPTLTVSVGLAVLLALLAPGLVIVGLKARRRRRRLHAQHRRDRVLGGWRELVDVAVDFGAALPPAATRLELAARLGGSEPVRAATLADRAAFSSAAMTDDEVDDTWRVAEEFRARSAAEQSRRRRIVAAVSLRSWRRRRRARHPSESGDREAREERGS